MIISGDVFERGPSIGLLVVRLSSVASIRVGVGVGFGISEI